MKIKLGAALAASLYLTIACTKSGTISSDGSSTVSGSILVTKVYPTSEGESWTAITSASRFYIKGLALSIKGTCSRGVAEIKVGESGTGGPFYSETASCQNDGSFVWSKTYTGPLDVDKTITLVAYDISDNVITGADDAVDVHVDNVAPTVPVVSTPATSPYTHNGADTIFSILGTVSADTVRLTGPYSSTITPTGVNWTHDVTLVPAASLDFTYYAWDLAGNQSAGFTQTIEWNPSLSLLVSGAHPGGVVVDGVSNYSMESAVHFVPGTTTDGVSNYELETGFNFVTNSARQ